jgi:hypothetical protein
MGFAMLSPSYSLLEAALRAVGKSVHVVVADTAP